MDHRSRRDAKRRALANQTIVTTPVTTTPKVQQAMVPFNFHGDNLEVVKDGDKLWVSVRRVCEGLGVSFGTQRNKLNGASWACVSVMSTHDTTGRKQEAFMIDIDNLPMWLTTINPNRVNERVRSRLAIYQQEAANVLRDHFFGVPAQINPHDEISESAFRRGCVAQFLGKAQESGLVSAAYCDRYVAHSIAIIDGSLPSGGPRLLDVSSFLEGKGLSASEVHRISSRFGKALKGIYVGHHGKDPEKVYRLIAGAERLVNSYTETDRPLFEQAYGIVSGDISVPVIPQMITQGG